MTPTFVKNWVPYVSTCMQILVEIQRFFNEKQKIIKISKIHYFVGWGTRIGCVALAARRAAFPRTQPKG